MRPGEALEGPTGAHLHQQMRCAMSITYVRKIKKVEEVKIGDWYEGREVIATNNWGFAVDIHLDDGQVKMHEAGLTVVVSVPESEGSR